MKLIDKDAVVAEIREVDIKWKIKMSTITRK